MIADDSTRTSSVTIERDSTRTVVPGNNRRSSEVNNVSNTCDSIEAKSKGLAGNAKQSDAAAVKLQGSFQGSLSRLSSSKTDSQGADHSSIPPATNYGGNFSTKQDSSAKVMSSSGLSSKSSKQDSSNSGTIQDI